MVETMVVLEMIVGIEVGSPWFCLIGAAYGDGVVPVRFSDEISVTFAIDDSQISSCRIMDVDFGPAAQAENGADGGKELAKLSEAEGDWLGVMRSLRFASDGFRSLWFLGWVAEMESFFDT